MTAINCHDVVAASKCHDYEPLIHYANEPRFPDGDGLAFLPFV